MALEGSVHPRCPGSYGYRTDSVFGPYTFKFGLYPKAILEVQEVRINTYKARCACVGRVVASPPLANLVVPERRPCRARVICRYSWRPNAARWSPLELEAIISRLGGMSLNTWMQVLTKSSQMGNEPATRKVQ